MRLLGSYGTALQAASAQNYNAIVAAGARSGPEDHIALVQLLLGRGADVNAPGGLYRHALRAASLRGQHEIVRMLTEHGAIMDDPLYCPPFDALFSNNVDMNESEQ